jgi:hypothetical protein
MVLTDKFIDALNPVPAKVDTVSGSEPLRRMLTEVESDDRAKVPKTIKLKGKLFVTLPLTPITVTGYVSAGTFWATLSDIMALPEPGAAIVDGLNVAVTPLGSPLTDIPTAELNPFTATVTKVTFLDPPGAMVALMLLEVRLNPGVSTVKLNP